MLQDHPTTLTPFVSHKDEDEEMKPVFVWLTSHDSLTAPPRGCGVPLHPVEFVLLAALLSVCFDPIKLIE